MQCIHLAILVLQSLVFPTRGQVVGISQPITLITVSTGSTNTTLPLATAGSLIPESQECSGNSSLLNFCPACSAALIPFGGFGAYAVVCNSVYTNVRYYKDIQQATVSQCIEACQDLRHCHAPVVSPDGTCLLAVVEPGTTPTITSGMGYAVFEAKTFPSSSRIKKETTSSSIALGGAAPSRTTKYRSLATHTSKHSPICKASAIGCPHCNGAHVRDPFGKLHEVLCHSQLWSEEYYSIQQWLTPEGCMAECDKYDWCKGSSFWPPGNCELARGVDAFPRYQPGYTAFLPGNIPTPSPSLQAFTTPSTPPLATPLSTTSQAAIGAVWDVSIESRSYVWSSC